MLLTPIIVKETPALTELRGRTLAVDGNGELYQFLALIRSADGTPLQHQGRMTSHLVGLFYRTTRLVGEYGVRPIVVFDGRPPELKLAEIARRREQRARFEAEAAQARAEGDLHRAYAKSTMSSRLTREMIAEARELLELLGIPVVQAPGEGEAQAAFMAARGDAWAAASKDYDALLFGTPRNTEDYGIVPANYKAPITQAFKSSQRFWDVNLFDVQAMSMQNDMLADHDRVARIIGVLFGVDEAEADATATQVQALLNSSPALDGGRNPLFTLNAFAFSAEGETDPIFQGLPDKMIWGEGLAAGLDALGLGTAAAKGVIAHEMAHHVQFEDNLFDSPLTGPEATRRTELMADAFGTYHVAHKRGLNLKGVNLHKVEQAFFEVGDCAFDNPGHHGTPNQRLRASLWGAGLAAKTPPPFRVLPSLTLDAKFEKKLPDLVRPDAKNTSANTPAA